MTKYFLSLVFLFSSSLSSAPSTPTHTPSTRPHSIPYIGTSAYAAMSTKFPCGNYLAIAKAAKKPAMAVLWRTFGEDKRCILSFLKIPKPKALEIHFSNEVCRRNNRCFEGEFLNTLNVAAYNSKLEKKDARTFKAITNRVAEILVLTKTTSSSPTLFILSTGLEDNYSKKAYENLFSAIRSIWPYEIVRNPRPETDTYLAKATLIEFHRYQPTGEGKRCIWNGDGNNIEDQQRKDIEARFSTCKVLLFWSPPAQGLFGQDFIPPRTRFLQITFEDIQYFKTLVK